MLFVWIFLLAANAFFAFLLAGTWQGIVSLFFVVLSTYYIGQHIQKG